MPCARADQVREISGLVNRDLFGFAIRWFRDFDLQQAVFVGCLDILGIHTQRQEEIQDSLTTMPKPVYRCHDETAFDIPEC